MITSSVQSNLLYFKSPFDENLKPSSNDINSQDKELSTKNKDDKELSSSERQQVSDLQQRDAEVKAHEAAHIAAGGSSVGGSASYTYQEGPDGKLYAIGGEVPISSSGGSTPEETIRIAQEIQAGALAPANPSAQDLKVASSAALMESKARQELSKERSDELKEKGIQEYESSQDNEENSVSLDISA